MRIVFVVMACVFIFCAVMQLRDLVWMFAKSEKLKAKIVDVCKDESFKMKPVYNLVARYERDGAMKEIRTETAFIFGRLREKKQVEKKRAKWVGKDVTICYVPDRPGGREKGKPTAWVRETLWKEAAEFVLFVLGGAVLLIPVIFG